MVAGMQIKYGGIKEIYKNISTYKKEIVLIAVLYTAYRITYYISASMANISLVWPLNNVPSVIIIVFFGGLLFKEGSLKRKLILTCVMLVCVYFIIL
jgi:uncharacterized membrane protein